MHDALTQRSKGQRSRSHGYENCHGRTVASDHVSDSAHLYAAVLPEAVAGVGLHVDTTAYVYSPEAMLRFGRIMEMLHWAYTLRSWRNFSVMSSPNLNGFG